MKKILLAIFMIVSCVSGALAQNCSDMEIAGKVTNVDMKKNMITIETPESVEYVFAVIPMTEFEFEDRVFDAAEFEDVVVDSWINVDYINGKQVHTAKEIAIYDND